jgi:glycosyltransferase involved in cell wall biosynthesis
MRILFVHQNFPGQYKHLAVALARLGHEVVALGTAERGNMAPVRYIRYRSEVAPNDRTHPWVKDLEAKVIRGQACLQAAARLQAQGFTPDLICAHPGWGEPLFLKQLWPQTPQLHYVEFFYRSQGQDSGFDPEFGQMDLARKARLEAKNANNLLNLNTMDAGICPTTWQHSTLPRVYQPHISVIHDGIDTQRLQPQHDAPLNLANDQGQALRFTQHETLITYVARNLEPYRGYHQFMRALPRILRACPNARVVIVGGDGVSYGAAPPKGSWKSHFANEMRGLLDWTRVHYVGRLPYAQLVAVLQRSHAHVYLTYPFVLSWSMLEAMSVGALVIASDTAPVREVITHGENGWLVDFFDPKALADQVIEVVHNPEKQQAIRRAARALMVQRYDLRTHCLPAQLKLVTALAQPQD